MIGITHADTAWYDNANNRFRHIDVDPYCKQEYQFTYHVIWKSRPERRLSTYATFNENSWIHNYIGRELNLVPAAAIGHRS